MNNPNPNTLILRLVCAIAIAGNVLRPGELVEVTRTEAKDLLRRGKAVLHEDPIEDDQAVHASGSQEPGLHPDVNDYNADQDAAAAAAAAAEAAAGQEAAQEAAGDATEAAGNAGQAEGQGAPQAPAQGGNKPARGRRR